MRLPHFLQIYLLRHAQVALNSLGRLYRAPLASLMTAAVIGIALALPCRPVPAYRQPAATQHTLGRGRQPVTVSETHRLGTHRHRHSETNCWTGRKSSASTSSRPDQALAEFRELSGFGEALDALEDNPLPAVLAIKPVAGSTDSRNQPACWNACASCPKSKWHNWICNG